MTPSSATSIDRHLELAAEEDPDAALLTFGPDGEWLSRAELLERGAILASALRELELGSGDRIGVMLSNRPEFVDAIVAASRLGAIVVPINVSLRGDSLRHVLVQTDPRVVVTERAHLSNLRSALHASPATVVCVDLEEEEVRPRLVGRARLRSAESSNRASATPTSSDPFAIMYTSGTTGSPKGAVWTHGMAEKVAQTAVSNMAYRPEDIIFTALPLFHGNGLALTVYAALLARARAAVMREFSASAFWRQIASTQATTVNLLGSMAQILWRQPASDLESAHALRVALVIPSPPPDQYEDFEARFSLSMVEAYGLTDVGMLLWIPADERRPGSCGRPTSGWECRLMDENDCEVARGEVGELAARPLEADIVPLGYWQMPEATLAARRNLWIHTGDMFRVDGDGWFRFVGRRKDTIRRRGENVSAFEVEQALQSHPAVEECAAFGVPSELGEDDVAAAIVLLTGHSPSSEDLVSHCEQALPYFAVPRYLRFLDSLPKTATEKVMKGALAAQGVTADTWDAERAGFRVTR